MQLFIKRVYWGKLLPALKQERLDFVKALDNIQRIQVNSETLFLLLSLYESKGKSFYYADLFKRSLAAFEKKTIENDLVSLGHYLELKMTDTRIRLFAKKAMTPKTKDEQLLQNLKIALTQLHDNPGSFELLVNEIGNLVQLLSRNTDVISFNTYEKNETGLLRTKKTSKKTDLEKLIELFVKNIKSGKCELTQLFVNFYVDFLNMDILSRHNRLVGLVLLYALLAKEFSVFRYVSFFKLLLEEKDNWESGLVAANYSWSSGFAQTDTISIILIRLLLEAYAEIDDISHQYVFEKKLNKSNSIENSILKINKIFSKEDIRKRHPNISDATIDRTLKRLKEEDKIRPLGKGRSSKWQRIVASNTKYGTKQLTLFND